MAPVRVPQAIDRRLLGRRSAVGEVGRRGRADGVVDLHVDPDPSDQEEQGENGREQLLALGRLDLVDIHARAHFGPFRSCPRSQLDDQLAVERLGDPEQRVDPRRPAARLEPRDRRLRRPGQLGQLLLGEAEGLPLIGDLLRDAREEPALVGVDVGEPFAKPLESIRGHISRLL